MGLIIGMKTNSVVTIDPEIPAAESAEMPVNVQIVKDAKKVQ